MKKPTGFSRRRFLGSTALLSGAAMGASHFSLATSISSQGKGKQKVYKKAPLFDPTLENYPGYSAHIPVPKISEPDDEQSDTLFTGL
jgi:hypothetical protein